MANVRQDGSIEDATIARAGHGRHGRRSHRSTLRRTEKPVTGDQKSTGITGRPELDNLAFRWGHNRL